jgi:hypothetical protein
MKNKFSLLIFSILVSISSSSCKKCITCTYQETCAVCVFIPNNSSTPSDTIIELYDLCEGREIVLDEEIEKLKRVYDNGTGILQCTKNKLPDKLIEERCGLDAEEKSAFLYASEILGYVCIQN